MEILRGQAGDEATAQWRILVVDDEPMMREVLVRYLNLKGFSTTEAQNGEQALNLFQDRPFDLIISDLRMPGMDGLKLLHAVKGINPRVPIVFISGYGDVPTVVECLKAGAENFLAKPLEMDILGKVVLQSLNLPGYQNLSSPQLTPLNQVTLLEAPSRPEYIKELVYQVSHSAVTVGFADCDLDNNLKLALVEAITNAMEHGHKWEEDLLVSLEADLSKDYFQVTVTDQGEGFAVDSLPDPTSEEQLFSERGRGVFLMQAIMDEVIFNQEGNQVTLIKRRPPAEPENPF